MGFSCGSNPQFKRDLFLLNYKSGEIMRRGTTPTYIQTIDGYNLTDKTVYVTIKDKWSMLTLTNDVQSIVYDDGASVVAFRLTQEQTLSFREGKAEVQVRFIDAEGIAKATDIKLITVERILKPGVITYEGDDSNA